MSTPKAPNLLGVVRRLTRRQPYSIHTERAYCTWIKRFVRYHEMTCRQNLDDGEARSKRS